MGSGAPILDPRIGLDMTIAISRIDRESRRTVSSS
jgi:hypothetical protein